MSSNTPPPASDHPRVAAVAAKVAADHHLAARLEPFQGLRWNGDDALPQLQLDDVSGIPFLDGISGVEDYQHRARLRARHGDLLATVTPQRDGEETYYRERLELGEVEWIRAEQDDRPLELAAACSRPSTLETLSRCAADAGALVLHPFMGIEPVWELARRLAATTAAPIEVLAPPPPVTWIANDKAAFSDLVVALLGEDWVAAERRSRRPDELAAALLELASLAPGVALKRLRCASAMGNRVFDSEILAGGGAGAARDAVDRFLADTRWTGDEEVQAVVWEQTELSPSTQWWLPPASTGQPPRLDGIYEQILIGREKVFAGSRPSTLPAAVHRGLAAAGTVVAGALQSLGYVGRCSFDHLVVGDPAGDHQLRFTECNGRWGGTSLPMELVDRLFGAPQGAPRSSAPEDTGRGSAPEDTGGSAPEDTGGSAPEATERTAPDDPAPRRRPYRAMDVVAPALRGVPFREVLRRVGDRAYDALTGRGSFLFYNVGPLDAHGKLDVVALGDSAAEVERLLSDELPRLLIP